jgi:hypothetical protein
MDVQSRLHQATTAKGWLDECRPLPALVFFELREVLGVAHSAVAPYHPKRWCGWGEGEGPYSPELDAIFS